MQYSLWYVVHNTLTAGDLVTEELTESVPQSPDHQLATYCVQHTTSCTAQSDAPEDGQNCCPKHVELSWIC